MMSSSMAWASKTTRPWALIRWFTDCVIRSFVPPLTKQQVTWRRQATSFKRQATSLTIEDYRTIKDGNERIIMKYKLEAKSTKLELKDINDKLMELYNTPGMALHFQPSKLKILKEQIERLIMLEQVVWKQVKL